MSFLFFTGLQLMAQTPPQGNPPFGSTNSKANAAWYRGGNNLTGTNPIGANIFGSHYTK